MTKNITIASDKNYLLFGISLIRSLQKESSIPLTIHYYCIDNFSFNALTKLNLSNVVVYNEQMLLDSNTSIINEFIKLKKHNYTYFCWSVASVFTNHIMNLIDNDSVTYIDSDILFHQDIKIIFNEIQNKDIGIFKHRFLRDDQESEYGKYNVGIVYFKNSPKGKELLNWWADGVVYKKYAEYATCGDQKYLEYFPKNCSSEEIYIDDNIGHGAPWQWQVCNLDRIDEGLIGWRGKMQPFVFTHFSKFIFSIEKNGFIPTNIPMYYGYTNGGQIFQHQKLYRLHEYYFNELKNTNNILKSVGVEL
jgi:hypothetical protein